MQFHNQIAKCGELRAGSFDKQQDLLRRFDFALPSVHALDGGQQVDARGYAVKDKGVCKFQRLVTVRTSAEHNERISHKMLFSLDLSSKQVYK
jgi:hypothetical protein